MVKCEFCNKSFIPKSIQISIPDSNNRKRTYDYYPCCAYYKRLDGFSRKAVRQLYEEGYFVHQYGGLSLLKWKLFLFIKGFSLRRYITNKDILEVGAATGEFLDTCRDFNPNSITGLEISNDASRIAYKRYGLKFIVKNFEDFKSDKKFDSIFLFHVIEHVKDPILVIKKCMSLLKQNGTLVLETPNIDSLEFFIFKEKWLAWMPKEHSYLFSTYTFESISKLFKVKKDTVIFSPISNVLPTQVLKSKIIMGIYPIFLIGYTFVYFLSYLFKKSGIVTIIFKKT